MRFWILFLLAGTGTAQWQPLESGMLAAHNAARARVGVAPLAWSSRLARVAQEWANHLLAHHQFAHSPHPVYGENLFSIRNGSASVEEVFQAWAEESKDYDYRHNRCRGACGHYTQIVWGSTMEVGCAVARGGDREVWVCDYDPPGNWVGMRPY
jgi:pathogenesis-related protein 1